MPRLICSIVSIFFFTACATPPAGIQTTTNPAADLGRLRTFTFLEADPKDKGAITDPAVNGRLRQLIARQLVERGYLPAASGQTADLGVLFAGHVEPKQRVLMTGRSGPYSYNWGRAEPGGQTTLDYREGTLVVDLVDLSRNELAWRARISEALTAGYSEENWRKLDIALGDAFKTVPQRR
jgi:hypothetical protein